MTRIRKHLPENGLYYGLADGIRPDAFKGSTDQRMDR
jgi:hypothetical protein